MKSGRTLQHSIVVALLLVMSWMFVAPRPASAATIVVDGVTCTLADAITAANTDTTSGGCPAGNGADTLDLVADITLTCRLPAIVSELALMGNGHTIQRSPSAPAFRILEIGYPGNATIDGVTITGGEDETGGGILSEWRRLTITNSTIDGNAAGSGGGVYCWNCQLFMSHSIVRNNSATYAGGGIGFYYYEPLDETNTVGHARASEHTYCGLGYFSGITDSTISGNSAQVGGGLSISSGSFYLEGSTISDNVATKGGGLSNFRGGGCIDSSTFSGNTASEKGGALYNESFALKNEPEAIKPLTSLGPERMARYTGIETPDYGGFIDLSNSTIVDNSAPLGAGLYTLHVGPLYPAFIGRVEPLNTIMAAQTSGVDCVSENGALIISQGFNIESSTSCGFTASGDQQNVTAAQLNLAPLANNGGPTWTHALTPGSAAIDQGSCPTSTADQRGYPRPVDIPTVPNAADGCDVGAFEAETPLAVTTLAFEAVDQPERSPLPPLVVAVLVASLLLLTRLRHGRSVFTSRHLRMPHSSNMR